MTRSVARSALAARRYASVKPTRSIGCVTGAWDKSHQGRAHFIRGSVPPSRHYSRLAHFFSFLLRSSPASKSPPLSRPSLTTLRRIQAKHPFRPPIPSPIGRSPAAPLPDRSRILRIDSPDRWFILPLLSEVVLAEQIRHISWINPQHGCRLPLDPVSTRERFKQDLFFQQVQFFP